MCQIKRGSETKKMKLCSVKEKRYSLLLLPVFATETHLCGLPEVQQTYMCTNMDFLKMA